MQNFPPRRVLSSAVYDALRGSAAALSFDFGLGTLLPTVFIAPMTYTRATVATVTDFEGLCRNVISGEARFGGMRRVRNLLTKSESGFNFAAAGTNAPTITNNETKLGKNTVKIIFPVEAVGGYAAGRAQESIGGPSASGLTLRSSFKICTDRALAVGESFSIYFAGLAVSFNATSTTGILQSEFVRFVSSTFTDTSTGSFTVYTGVIAATPLTVWITELQTENVTNQSNQNPSEYVSVGAAKLNEIVQSEDFATTWSASSVTVAANAVAGPDGATTADTLTASGANGTVTQAITAVAADYTFSVWLKRKTGTGDIQIAADNGTYTTVVIDGTWQRYSVTQTLAAGAKTCGIKIVTNTDAVWAWGAQLTRASTLTNYFPVGNVYPYHGAMVDGVRYFATQNGNTVAANVVTEATGASVEGYVTGSYTNTIKGFQIEEARTNLVLQSSNYAATWAAVVTPTTGTAGQCGDISIPLIGDDSAIAVEGFTQTVTYTGDAVKQIAFIVKKDTSTSSIVRLRDTTAGADRLLVAITWTGTVPTATYTTGSSERASEALGGGYYRIFALTSSVTAANTNSLQVYPATTSALDSPGTGNIYIGGWDSANALFATSHIPTTTATVTRNADAPSAPLGGWFNATEGTIVTRASTYYPGNNQYICALSDGTTNEMIGVRSVVTTGNAQCLIQDGGVAQATLDTGVVYAVNTLLGHANAYKLNDCAASASGSASATDAAATMPTVTTLSIGALNASGSQPLNGFLRRLDYYDYRVRNARLQVLS